MTVGPDLEDLNPMEVKQPRLPVLPNLRSDLVQASLRAALGPVTDAARVMLRQLRPAGRADVEVELKVKLTWKTGDDDRGQ